jgi:hypothetical protein
VEAEVEAAVVVDSRLRRNRVEQQRERGDFGANLEYNATCLPTFFVQKLR